MSELGLHGQSHADAQTLPVSLCPRLNPGVGTRFGRGRA